LDAWLAFLGAWLACAVTLPARAAEPAPVDPSLELLAQYREVARAEGWQLYFLLDSLEIWTGNPPYERMKNGHAAFAAVFDPPLEAGSGRFLRSARISYVFTCSPRPESYFSAVEGFDTPFVPRATTLPQQWHAWRHRVMQRDQAQAPD
jgi:hypothetical protein